MRKARIGEETTFELNLVDRWNRWHQNRGLESQIKELNDIIKKLKYSSQK